MCNLDVKIPYAKIDTISIQFNFTTKAYIRSLKETKSQDIHKFIMENPHGEENPTKIPLYRCIKSTKIESQTHALPPCRYISLPLSYALYTSEHVFKMRKTHPLFIIFLSFEFFPNRSSPTNLLGRLHLGRHKTVLYYIQEGTIDPTYLVTL